MDADKLIELLDTNGLEGFEDYVANNADELIDRLDELDDEVIELVVENSLYCEYGRVN